MDVQNDFKDEDAEKNGRKNDEKETGIRSRWPGRSDCGEPGGNASGGRCLIAVKVFLSVYIAYHLLTVLVLPNGGSIIGRSVSRYVMNYATLFGFNTPWQFFSPGPASASYVEYRFETAAQSDDADEPQFTYPPLRAEGHPLDDFFNRRLYAMRFFLMVPNRLEEDFVPFLCKQQKDATGVWIHQTFDIVPVIERADGSNFKELAERQDLPRQHFDCPPAPAAANL